MPKEAIKNLIEARKTRTVQEEANWALALAYLEANQKDKAKGILEEIIHAKAYKYKRAEILLAKL
jgi:Tfp pilus assembly protein PilF